MRMMILAATVASSLLLASSRAIFAQAVVVDWNAPPTISGDWNENLNWLSPDGAFVPNAEFEDSARINNGGTALVNSAVPDVINLTVSNGTLQIDDAGELAVRGELLVTGGGLLHLTGNGSLSVGGDARNSVRITGPSVQYSVGGNYTASARLVAEITGVDHSAIDVTGTADLGGTLQVDISGAAPSFGQSWPLITAGAVNGSFAALDASNSPPLPRGLQYQVQQAGGDVSVAVGNSLILTIDRLTGSGVVENVLGGPVDFKGYTLRSAAGFLNPDGWSSLASSGAGGAGWEVANPKSMHLSELNLTEATSLAVGDSLTIGRPYVPGPQSTDQEDVQFEYIRADGNLVQAIVEYTGPVADLVLNVDPETGAGAISKLSPFFPTPDVKGYSIRSMSGSMTPNSWIGFQDSGNAGDGWEEANPQPDHLSELNLDSSTEFATNTLISLGNFFAPGGTPDLVFEYITAAGHVLLGTVEYGEIPVVMPGLRGDFNLDGVVDRSDIDLLGIEIAGSTNDAAFDLTGDNLVNGADRDVFLGDNIISDGNKLNGDADFSGQVQFPDFVILADNFAQMAKKWSEGDFDTDGQVQFPDFVILADNFGMSAAAAASVPEPSGLMLGLMAVCVGTMLRGRPARS